MHMFYSHFVPSAPDEPVGGPGADAAAQAAAQQQAAQQAAQTPAASESPQAPWAQSLAQAFPEEDHRARVDQYIRSEIQPYITRREQELGQVGDIWDSLWDEDQSVVTYLELANSIYGEEAARALAQTLSDHFEKQGLPPEQAAAAGVQAANQQAAAEGGEPQVPKVLEFDEYLQTLPPEAREVIVAQRTALEDQTYEGQLDQLAKVEPTIDANRSLFSRYVASAEGDLNSALSQWQAEMAPVIKANPQAFGAQGEAAAQAAGAVDAAAAAAAAPAREAPVVLGTGAAAQGGVTPPLQKEHQSLDEAVEDFMKDMARGKAGAAGRV